ncbi:MAG: hypothetical protein ACFB2W_00560 [Leptolyngbyaceae cyanobacterium]
MTIHDVRITLDISPADLTRAIEQLCQASVSAEQAVRAFGAAVNASGPAGIPSPCQGCRNYHGQTYGGHHLVCALHPHGAEGDECGDWESY